MKNKTFLQHACIGITLILLPITLTAATSFNDFIKDLKSALFSGQGKGKVIGHSGDFAFIEITEGIFKNGDLVIIKERNNDLTVHEDLFEDAAYGEVELVKDKVAKVYVTNKLKNISKDAPATSVKKIYVNIIGTDDITPVQAAVIREKDVIVLEKPDPKVSIKIYLTKIAEGLFGYRVVSYASNRIILVGTIAMEPQEVVSPKKSTVTASFPVPKEALHDIAYDDEIGRYWVLEDSKASCLECEKVDKGKISLGGKGSHIFYEDGALFIWDESGRSTIFKGNEAVTIQGMVLQGDKAIYDVTKKRIMDAKGQKILASRIQTAGTIYYYKNGKMLHRLKEKVILSKIEKTEKLVKELIINPNDIIRIKKDQLYLYTEEKEEVPLAGTYSKMMIKTFNISDLVVQKSVEFKDAVTAFDIDEKNGDIIYLKPDGTIKRMKL